MQLLWMIRLLLLMTATAVAANGDDLEEEVLRETVAAGRGERDEIGFRDQWSSTDHLHEASKFDARKPVSANVRRLLREYRLDCDGCDQKEATALINAFVLETKRRARYNEWVGRAVILAVALGAIVCMFIGVKMSSGSSGSVVDGQMRWEIEMQRRRAVMQEDSNRAAEGKRRAVPTWRDNEVKEMWTPKQEKQFAKALVEYGGIPPKERYRLIAAKVNGKCRQECLMHHKLQQLKTKDQ